MSVPQRTCDAFQRTYARPPYWIANAPGRVNLIGEFTDYNDGFVLPMAIEQRTAIAASPNASSHIVIRSEAAPEPVNIDLTKPITPDTRGSWTNYPKGIVARFLDAGYKVRGFDAVVYSNVPIGAGLSSSAALEVATATLLEAVCDVELEPIAKALLCQKAEHTFAGVPCGIMDPFIATLAREGEALLLDCRSQERHWIPLKDPAITVLVINTNVKHHLATSAYAQRRQECLAAARALDSPSLREASLERLTQHASDMDPVIFRRARHVITEISRTLQAARCIREHEWVELGQLLDASHNSLRDDFEVSCRELDAVVELAHKIGRRGGVLGCRMTGGGFGGCAVALIEAAQQESIIETISRGYRDWTGIEATLFPSRPAAGAELIEV
jgi:galactokinase